MSLAAVGIIASVASTAIGAAGAVMQGQAASAQAQYQANIARMNQQIQTQNAQYERQKGDVEAQQQDMKNKALMGAQEAAMGASGLDMASPSFVDTRDSSKRLGRLDTLTVRNNAERRAHEFDIAATNQGAQAGLYGMQAKSSNLAGYIGAASSLVGGASSVADKWLKYQNNGIKLEF